MIIIACGKFDLIAFSEALHASVEIYFGSKAMSFAKQTSLSDRQK
jgi:hypothetical protein